MEVKELRLGNIVECYINGELKNGSHIVDADDIKISQSNDWYGLEPIPLTEEWLLNFGFEWSIPHQAYFKQGFDYVIDFYETYPNNEGCLAFINKHKRNGENLVTLKHVHKLQNLYFALTGEELVLTEKQYKPKTNVFSESGEPLFFDEDVNMIKSY